jgi:hypothetical protein
MVLRKGFVFAIRLVSTYEDRKSYNVLRLHRHPARLRPMLPSKTADGLVITAGSGELKKYGKLFDELSLIMIGFDRVQQMPRTTIHFAHPSTALRAGPTLRK